MDLDLEIDGNEKNSPESIFRSIVSAMGSKKGATADEIHKKIQEEGLTNYSKPQVDRALENALQYGIFEVRNNRYRVRDDVLDDEDTIYWQAHIKRERTPYRMENNQRDYINPEKDQHTFRRFYVGDGEGCTSCRRHIAPVDGTRSGKGRVSNKTAGQSFQSIKCPKSSGDQRIYKSNISKMKKVPASKRQQVQGKQVPAKRAAQKGGKNVAKKRKQDTRYYIPDHKHDSHYTQESDSDASGKVVKKKRKANRKKNNEDYYDEDDDDENEDEEDDDGDDDEDEDEDEDEYEEDNVTNTPNNKQKRTHSSYYKYMKEPFASKYSPKGMQRSKYPCEMDFDQKSSVTTLFPNDNNMENGNQNQISSKWNMNCRHRENLHADGLCGRADWLVNRPQNTEDGTVKQFENALNIEPLDSLPFKNMEEPSYIS